MIGEVEIYKEFEIEVTVTLVSSHFRTFTSIARCEPRPLAAIQAIFEERMDWSAAGDHIALARAFFRARKDVDAWIANGSTARI